MAISLKNLHKQTADETPFQVIYGPPGYGKTSLAAEFPKPIFLHTESVKVKGLELTTFTENEITSFDDIIAAIEELYDQDHDFKTLNLDSLDQLEPLVWKKTCEVNSWPDIESPGYGKGYVAADAQWQELIKRLKYLRRDRQMNINLIGHSIVERFDDPQTVSYSRYDFRLHKRGHALVEDLVDAILFVNLDPTIKIEDQGFKKTRAHAEGGHTRWINTSPRPAWNAKNRFDMPERILYEKGKGYAVLAPYYAAQPAKQAA